MRFISGVLLDRVDVEPKEVKKEIDETFWELLMSADKKDYESICFQYGVTDFRRMLNKLSEKKIEREEEQSKVWGFCDIVLTSSSQTLLAWDWELIST